MLQTIKKHHGRLLFFLFAAIIFIFRIRYIRETNVLAIRNDEYGYWNHAALFSGHDWSDVFAKHMNWYSYGYSLVLTPLFWLSHDLHLLYKAAVVLNGVFGIASFYLCQKCAQLLFPKRKPWMYLVVSFMVCMYSSYLTQGAIAWSETFLYLLVWLVFYLFLRFEQHPSMARAAALSLCVGLCYVTHNRTIGIVTAYFLVVAFLRLTDSISWKVFAAMLLPLVLILFVNIDIKTYLCTVEGFGLKPKNGMGAQKGHLLSLLTIQGWQNLIRSLSGQLWCLMTSTFGLLFWGFLHPLARTFHAFHTRKSERHTTFYLFALLACTGTFFISAISLIDPASITNLHKNTDLTYFIYSRYDECVIGLLLLMGFFDLDMRSFAYRKFFLLTAGGCILYAAMSVILYFNLQRITGTWHYRSFCAAGIGFYRLFSEKFAMRWCILICAAGFFLLIFLLCDRIGKILPLPVVGRKISICGPAHTKDTQRQSVSPLHIHARSIRLLTACLLLVAAFIPTGLYSAEIGTISSQRGKISCGNLAMYDALKKVVGNRSVYCTLEDTKDYRIAYELQVNLIDTHVYSITLENLPVEKTGYFLCCSKKDADRLEGNDYYLFAQSSSYMTIIKGDALAQEVAALTGTAPAPVRPES